MILIGGLCEAYHWTVQDAMKLTMPQIIMLNHAAWVNKERAERRHAAKRDKEGSKKQRTWRGKDVRELDSNEFGKYWGKVHVHNQT